VNRSPVLPWILLLLWAAWAQAAQGLLAGSAAWIPDLGVVLLLSLAARLPHEALPGVALAVALGRIAVSVEPPTAVLAGMLALVAVTRGLRTVLEVDGLLARSLLAGLGAWVFALWLGEVHEARVLAESTFHAGSLPRVWAEQQPLVGAAGWRGPLATAGVALVFGPAVARLPGLGPLHRRKTWARGASDR